MKINCIHHVAIICSDFERSKHFYIDILGFKSILEEYRADRDSYRCNLEIAGKYQIELFGFKNAPERPSYPEARGLRHLAFEVDDIEEAIRDLNGHGMDVEDKKIRYDESSGKRFAFLHDPDGLPIELYEK
jgi:glyoxylase I family protein